MNIYNRKKLFKVTWGSSVFLSARMFAELYENIINIS